MGNLKSLMSALVEKRPPAVKGVYFKAAFLKSTMGPRFRIDLETIDPKAKGYQLEAF